MKRYLLILLCMFAFSFCDGEKSTEIPPPAAQHFQFPLEKYEAIYQDFGNLNAGAGNRYHCAEDIHAFPGTPVYAIADGEISYSGPAYGYGWLITIDHPTDSVYSLYGHVSTRRWKKTSGEVEMGEHVAY